MPDFGVLSIPNFAATAAAGYQAGQSLGKEKRLSAALAGYDPTKPETALGVLREDPGMGMGLLNASTALANQHREAVGREALGKYLLGRLKGGDPASGVTQGGSTPATSGDVVVTAPTAEQALIQADPEKWLSVQDNLNKLDDNHRKALGDAAEAQGNVAIQALELPYEQRKAFIQSQSAYLMQHGVKPEEIAAFDPTDDNVHAQVAQAIGVKGMLSQQNTEADDARQDRNTDSEIASRALRDRLAVNTDARGATSRSEAHTRFTERNNVKGANKATQPVGPRATVGGKTYVKVNGKWMTQ